MTEEYAIGHIVAARYRVEASIGHGGFATVYRARRIPDDAAVALKVMHRHHRMSPIEIKRFDRESTLVSRLRHRNVVTLLDHGRTDEGLPFIVFELLRGRSLSARIKSEGALSGWRLGQVAVQTLRALVAAHRLRIAHRDIKPSNLFLCTGRADAYVRVLDFGIAKALTDEEQGATRLTQTGRLLGTPAYMSPEQVRGTGIGVTSDLYSLGLVMAEALTGKRVVEAPHNVAALMEHVTGGEHLLTEAVASSPFGPIIARAAKKRVEDRYPDAASMLADAERALELIPAVDPSRASEIPHSTDPPTPDAGGGTVIMTSPDDAD